MTYKLTSSDAILRIVDNAFIPADLGNRDYAEYLAWLSEGNEPLPVDPLSNKQLQAAVNSEARAYLLSTDWYVIRKHETGEAIPADIADERQAARGRVVE